MTNLGTKLQQILENPERMKKVKLAFYATLALLVVGDVFVHREHATFFWDKIPGFSAVYGFISCVLIIVLSKFIGHAGLMKPENYYEPAAPLVETPPSADPPGAEGGHSHS